MNTSHPWIKPTEPNPQPCSVCAKPGTGRWTVEQIDVAQRQYQVKAFCEPCWALFLLGGGRGLEGDEA